MICTLKQHHKEINYFLQIKNTDFSLAKRQLSHYLILLLG